MKTLTQKKMGGVLGMIFAAAVLWTLTETYSAYAGHSLTTTHAGTQIGNQATATYTDGSGVIRIATSNLVETVVAQVGAFMLAADGYGPVSVGGTLEFPHTLTNTGNGTDTFTLSLRDWATGDPVGLGPADTQDFIAFAIYADTDNDGRPDGAPLYNDANGDGDTLDAGDIAFIPAYFTGVPSGGIRRFVVTATVPAAVPSGTSKLLVTAVSVPGGTIPTGGTKTNTDTADITNNAVIDVVKSMSALSGPTENATAQASRTKYTITLEYSNSGNTTATDVIIKDVIPTGFVYVPDSGFWIGPNVNLSDVLETTPTPTPPDAGPDGVAGNTDDVAGISYDFTGTTVTAKLYSVPPNQSGRITFQVQLATISTAPLTIPNTATVAYDPDGTGTAAAVGPFNSNTVNFTATLDADVAMTPPATATPVPQGSVISFSNTVTNTGSGTDTFDITITANTFPAGTSFVLYKSDGSTVLTDTNGNGIPDTGPIVQNATLNATYSVILKVTLPPSATSAVAMTVTKQATSVSDPTETATAIDTLASILTDIVDIGNSATANTLGMGSGTGISTLNNGGVAWVTNNPVNPGTTTSFSLFIRNAQGGTNSYDLSASGTSTSFPGVVPASCGTFPNNCFTVVFKDAGVPVTSTGPVAPGAVKTIIAEVTVPPLTQQGTSQIFFRAISPTSGSATVDIKQDALTVPEVHATALSSSQALQGFPGAYVVYQHQVSNTGNDTENFTVTTADDQGTPAVAGDFNGWTSLVYRDDGDGLFNPLLDVLIPSGGTLLTTPLPQGGSATIWVKVNVPAGATAPTQNVTTLTVTPTDGHAAMVNADTTSVMAGTLELEKLQGLDLNCDGDVVDATELSLRSSLIPAVQTTGDTQADATPGTCILYQITATNLGNVDVTGVVINDTTPANTVMESSTAPAADVTGITPDPTVTAPADGAAGNISTSPFTITPSGAAVLKFTVKIN